MFNKSLATILSVVALLMNASCSNETTLPGEDSTGLFAEAPSKTIVGTRSSLEFGPTGMVFKWTGEDVLTVFADGNNESTQNYRLTYGAGGNRAKFSSADFALTKGKIYHSLSTTATKSDKVTIDNQDQITLEYSDQEQIGNANTTHLGKYDYMVCSAECKEDNNVNMDFNHLGLTLRMVMYADESLSLEEKTRFVETEFKTIEIYDASNDDAFRQQKRYYSFHTGWAGIGTDTDHFTLKLKGNFYGATEESGVHPRDGYQDGSSTPTNRLIGYIELPPFDFHTKSIGFILTGTYTKNNVTTNVTYSGSFDEGFNMLAGNAYQVNVPVKQTTDYQVTLRLNHNWQHGNDLSRATGDPGIDDTFQIPDHIYYIFCVDGKVRAVKDITGTGTDNPYNYIAVSGDGDDKWTTNSEKTVSTYGKKLTFPTTDGDVGKRKQLFVVAANRALSETLFSGIANNDPVSKVLALTYNISGDAQVFLRDLYSTPWENESSFAGNINNPIQDIVLYHTAAKVDLKWNYADALALTENDETSLIKVTDVKNTGLSLFQPAVNSNVDGSYSVTAPITYANYRNGRQVFYLPQFIDNKYNVTIGSNTYTGGSKYQFEGVTTTGGFTSWLRALIK